jgi:hypothetical protein
LEAYNQDNDQADDGLLIMTSSTDSIDIDGQLEPVYQGDGIQQKGRLETIQFTDTTMSIGSETAVQTFNAASKLAASEKEKRSKAAKKVIEEEEEEKKKKKKKH